MKPSVRTGVAAPVHREVEWSATVTIGEETAAKLRELGHQVKAGDTINLGVIAVDHPNRIVRAWRRWRRIHPHVLSDPRLRSPAES